MIQQKKHVIILGAGIAGLTAGWRLCQAGMQVTILEKDAIVGGLSKTVSYKKFLFDYSAHRFNSNNREVVSRFKKMVGSHLVRRKKITYIRHWGKFLQYPPRVIELVQAMPKLLLIQASLEFFVTFLVNLVYSAPKKSFADWTRGYFGKTLSYNLNEKYAEKIWKRPADQLSSDWASTRVGSFKLKDFLLAALFPSHYKKVYSGSDPDTDFFYYCDNGIGYFPKQMAKEIERLKGVVMTNTTVTKLERVNGQYLVSYTSSEGEKKVVGDIVISSIPLPFLCKLFIRNIPEEIAKAVAGLKYLNVLVVNILLNRKKVNDASWVYFPDKNIVFNYLVEFRNWSKKMSPFGKTSLSANITCMEGDETWKKNDEELIKRVIDDMIKIGQIERKDFKGGFISRVPFAYPIYDLEYRKKLVKIKEHFMSIKDFYIVGRTGAFNYSNADKVMEEALELSKKIIGNI